MRGRLGAAGVRARWQYGTVGGGGEGGSSRAGRRHGERGQVPGKCRPCAGPGEHAPAHPDRRTRHPPQQRGTRGVDRVELRDEPFGHPAQECGGRGMHPACEIWLMQPLARQRGQVGDQRGGVLCPATFAQGRRGIGEAAQHLIGQEEFAAGEVGGEVGQDIGEAEAVGESPVVGPLLEPHGHRHADPFQQRQGQAGPGEDVVLAPRTPFPPVGEVTPVRIGGHHGQVTGHLLRVQAPAVHGIDEGPAYGVGAGAGRKLGGKFAGPGSYASGAVVRRAVHSVGEVVAHSHRAPHRPARGAQRGRHQQDGGVDVRVVRLRQTAAGGVGGAQCGVVDGSVVADRGHGGITDFKRSRAGSRRRRGNRRPWRAWFPAAARRDRR